MLASRPRLQSWNPDSLTPAASALQGAGQSVYGAVRDLDDGIDRMSAAQSWSGQAHDAATTVFRRATITTSDFAHYTETVATALKKGNGR
ncbi:WXG100 family type VII secretion target [Mycolicibacterium holsaticum]|uniref:WXG100 family type VII secretion target n=1 Tax=Mycolicibacterium holsaticum TaxID=152142 RepID=UPI0035577423